MLFPDFQRARESPPKVSFVSLKEKLYEEVDGVAMVSQLQNRETGRERENKLPIFYKRFVDDTLGVILDPEVVSEFLETLNKSYLSMLSSMDLEENGRLHFLGMDVIRNGCRLDSSVN